MLGLRLRVVPPWQTRRELSEPAESPENETSCWTLGGGARGQRHCQVPRNVTQPKSDLPILHVGRELERRARVHGGRFKQRERRRS